MSILTDGVNAMIITEIRFPIPPKLHLSTLMLETCINWSEQQEVATINEISLRDGNVVIIPQYAANIDEIPGLDHKFEESLCEYLDFQDSNVPEFGTITMLGSDLGNCAKLIDLYLASSKILESDNFEKKLRTFTDWIEAREFSEMISSSIELVNKTLLAGSDHVITNNIMDRFEAVVKSMIRAEM